MAKNEELVPAESGGLAVPDYIKASNEGQEQIDQNDLSTPRLLVMNALSRQVKDEVAKLGDIVENVGQSVLAPRGKSIKGVFLAVRKMRNRWRPRGSGEGIECHSPDGRKALEKNGISKGVGTDSCAICEYSQFTKMPDGTIKAPACTEYREFLFLSPDFPMPLVLSLGKAAAKNGKKLVEKLNADMGISNRPLYAFSYELSTRLVIAKGNEWYEIVAKPAGFPDEKLFKQAQALYAKYKDSLKKQDYRSQEKEYSGDDLPQQDDGAPKM